MSKKNLIYYTFLAGLIWTAVYSSSCKRLVEIPPNPPTSITQAQVFADSPTAMTALAGVLSYPSNGTNGFTFNDGLLSPMTGLASDELMTSSADHNYTEFYTDNVLPLNIFASNLWADAYTGLYPVNASLEGVAGSTGLSASFRQEMTAELKVVRALYYFALVNLYGPVPVITSTDYKQTSQLGRAPVDSVYSQILRDLLDAKAALGTAYIGNVRQRPNRYAVQALLSKVYLYRQQWQQAYDEAGAITGAGIFSLETDPNNVFLDKSAEAIWQLSAANMYQMTREASTYIPYSTSVTPTYYFAPQLKSAFETGDKRFTAWTRASTVTISGVSQTIYIPYKYKQLQPATPVEDFMVFRLGDILLVHAEAAARLGKLTEALHDLNLVRTRAGLAGSTAVSQDDIIKAILHERQTELFTEWGNRWFDLKRTGTIDAVLSPIKPNWQSPHALLPVPQNQLDINIALKQNPGYQ